MLISVRLQKIIKRLLGYIEHGATVEVQGIDVMFLDSICAVIVERQLKFGTYFFKVGEYVFSHVNIIAQQEAENRKCYTVGS